MLFGKKPPIITDEKRVDELLSRGVAEVIPGNKALKELLMSGKQLRVKLGIDPTSPNLHLGRSVPLLKLKDFQDLGHQAILIVGDATGVIGDTSDKQSERPMLSQEEVKKNAETYFTQASTLLGDSFERRFNSEWLNKLSFSELGELANQFSVAEFIARDNIRRRLDAGTRVSLRETLYPLMQGYDSVAVKADVEIGGVDQRFNLLAGRTLQEHYNQPPQGVVMTEFPIEGLDGRKMSSSWRNIIAFKDEPSEMFGKVMSVKDELIEKYFRLLTRVPMDDVSVLLSAHPRDAKLSLATELVRMYHGEREAENAKNNFENTFSKGGVPDNVVECTLSQGESLIDALVVSGVVASKTEGRRLLEAGAIKITGSDQKITGANQTIDAGAILRVGKHRFVKIVCN
ncbi:tyrosine--tRNA ligase [Candidatus Kaiserbacteria bacterium CG10_big_fil_rev_8_21_14_0_10_45_20]|uniref:Tyrosine--tRNA ligase n=1 Tax=Candidatus Kaiserbacteria bacterium CG10_big_fil_rev_8_21_14_0_10_45_20 TaxID=1974607 RepID=A0A2H0UHA6_9BACT|nr:MAG: tyrosine--tRNA ligase [Candidatus Kaiserbacteria bacterium CG10_big_fil_rev_8_21_14_0_10_45_20]